MKPVSRFWSGLEAVSGLAAVKHEWQRAWGDEWDIGQALLRPSDQLASSYPCPRPGGDGCPRKVVIHSEQDIVAVCRAVPRQCDDLTLARGDIVVYELDWKALGTAIAEGLGLAGSPALPGILPLTAPLGWRCATGGKRVAVYLTIQYESQAFGAILSRLLADTDLPFILAAPTSSLCEADSTDLLRRMRVLFLPLDECLAWDESRGFVSTERLAALTSDLAAAPVAPDRQMLPGDARTLWLDPEGSLCYFRGAQVNLSKMPFDLLELLAREARKGKRWVSRDRISEACWPEEWARGNPATEDQINNVASELRKALRKDGNISAREARILVLSKVYYEPNMRIWYLGVCLPDLPSSCRRRSAPI